MIRVVPRSEVPFRQLEFPSWKTVPPEHLVYQADERAFLGALRMALEGQLPGLVMRGMDDSVLCFEPGLEVGR